MCVTCHPNPDLGQTELNIGLYPRPPRWDALGEINPPEAFWVLKHSIKASGMPAWGKSMDNRYLWGMVAFMQQFPGMSAAQYSAQVAASDGHSHGGGETDVGGGDPHAGQDASEVNRNRSTFEPVEVERVTRQIQGKDKRVPRRSICSKASAGSGRLNK